MHFSKLAQLVEMSLEIPVAEKKIARNIIKNFQIIGGKLKSFNKHLDIIFVPFNNNKNVSKESVLEYRASLRRYSEKIKENFSEIRELAAQAINELNFFSTDSHIKELINAFIDSFGDVENSVNFVISSIENWKSDQYRDLVIKSIEIVKKQVAQTNKLIEDRIIEHINTNILANNWMDLANNKDNNIKEPYIKQLFKEREEKLRKMLKYK